MIVLDGLVSNEWCAGRIAELTRRGFEPTGERYPQAYRDNDRIVIDDTELAAWLFERARPGLPAELVVDGERWVIAGLNPRFRACRYRGGQAFCIHRDGAHVATDDLRSHLTLQIYLDADPMLAGGRTRFYASAAGGAPVAAIAPRTGTAIAFDHRAWHDGEAVASGIKHVLRTDVMYRRTSIATHADRRHRGYAWSAIACRDGSIASVGRDGCVRRWFAGGRSTSLALGLGSITAIAEVPGTRTAIAETKDVLWCGTRAGALVREARVIASDLGAILSIAITREGVIAATARGELVALDPSGRMRWTRLVHAGWAWCVTPHPLGVASCGVDGRIAITSLDGTRTTTHAQLGIGLRALVVTPTGVIAGDTNGALHGSSLTGHAGAITSLAASDDLIFSSGEDGIVMRHDASGSVVVHESPDFVTSVRYANGELICADYSGAITTIPKVRASGRCVPNLDHAAYLSARAR